MKKNKFQFTKPKIAVISALSLAVLTLVGIGVSKANFNSYDRYNSLVQALVEKFNLNESEVQSVFDEHRDEHRNEMRQKNQVHFEERLDQAISNGELTQEQKTLILEKKEELQSQRLDDLTLSNEEKRNQMEQHRKEMEKWAEENGIDMKFFGFGKGLGSGQKRGLDRGMNR